MDYTLGVGNIFSDGVSESIWAGDSIKASPEAGWSNPQ
jgi:hypothetical protein